MLGVCQWNSPWSKPEIRSRGEKFHSKHNLQLQIMSIPYVNFLIPHDWWKILVGCFNSYIIHINLISLICFRIVKHNLATPIYHSTFHWVIRFQLSVLKLLINIIVWKIDILLHLKTIKINLFLHWIINWLDGVLYFILINPMK